MPPQTELEALHEILDGLSQFKNLRWKDEQLEKAADFLESWVDGKNEKTAGVSYAQKLLKQIQIVQEYDRSDDFSPSYSIHRILEDVQGSIRIAQAKHDGQYTESDQKPDAVRKSNITLRHHVNGLAIGVKDAERIKHSLRELQTAIDNAADENIPVDQLHHIIEHNDQIFDLIEKTGKTAREKGDQKAYDELRKDIRDMLETSDPENKMPQAVPGNKNKP